MSYGQLASHASMVFDEVRNRAYLDAMQALIGPETVVLDLGAGIGVLGLLAAKAGARHVYCVEPSPVARHIRPLAEANGVGDRVTAIQSRIEDAVLPEQVDLIVSVFTGNLLFTEGLLPSLYAARDRHLKPGGRLLPDRARLMLQAVDASGGYGDVVARFRSPSLGIDYSQLVDVAAAHPNYIRRDKPAPRPLSAPACAVELDFTSTTQADVAFEGCAPGIATGSADALVGWIEVRLGDRWLSTAPDAEDVHWSPALLPFSTPIEVAEGQAVDVGFRYLDDDRLHWSIGVGGDLRRQSTMLHNPDLLIEMQLSAAGCTAPLREEGEVVAEVLLGIRAGEDNRAIAARLAASWPRRFPDPASAMKEVGKLAARYRRHPARRD